MAKDEKGLQPIAEILLAIISPNTSLSRQSRSIEKPGNRCRLHVVNLIMPRAPDFGARRRSKRRQGSLPTRVRQTATKALVDLNFKVPAEFRLRFKRLALDAQLKNIQLLNRAVEAYEREQGREQNR